MPNRRRRPLKWVSQLICVEPRNTVNTTPHHSLSLLDSIAHHFRHPDRRVLAMHPEHFRRHPVHPSHLGGGHGRCDFRLLDCAVLLLRGKCFVCVYACFVCGCVLSQPIIRPPEHEREKRVSVVGDAR